MSRVITFSTKYPGHHPRKGEHTEFVQKLRGSFKLLGKMCYPLDYAEHTDEPKHHTIRRGFRREVGQKFNPRFWSGIPYKTSQIGICSDIEIKKIWNVEINIYPNQFWVDYEVKIEGRTLTHDEIIELAKNDGLTEHDFINWFRVWKRKPSRFIGQIICWNENINY